MSYDRGGVHGVVNWGVVDSVSNNRGSVHGVGSVVGDSVAGSSEVGEGGEGNISLGSGISQGDEGGQAESLEIGQIHLNLIYEPFLCPKLKCLYQISPCYCSYLHNVDVLSSSKRMPVKVGAGHYIVEG